MKTFVTLLCVAALTISGFAAGKTVAQKRELNFSHKLHIETNSIECAQCHAAAAKSIMGRDNLLPGHAECSECHDVQTANSCTMCHLVPNPQPQPFITDYSPKFPHATHLEQAKLACVDCHKNLDQAPDEDHAGHYPNMTECMACHEQREASVQCLTCHRPGDPKQPKDHLVNWLNRHGAAASMAEEQQCTKCHGHSNIVECQSCHTGDQVFFPHPRNYISRHGQDAHLSDLRCATCHDQREFCNNCHRQNNILPAGHFRPGWVNSGGGEHSTEAAFDLESCMSCHDTPSVEPVCARCHGK